MPRASDGEKIYVGRWTALLLIALGAVLILLYVAARLLMSREHEQLGLAMRETTRRAFVPSLQKATDREGAVAANDLPAG